MFGLDKSILETINQAATATANMIEQMVKTSLSKLRSNVKPIYSEEEAAEFLGMSKETLARFRRAKMISFIEYPPINTEFPEHILDEKKRKSRTKYSYFLPDLMNFAVTYRHEPIRTREVYKFVKIINPSGLELEK